MPDSKAISLDSEKKQKISAIFERLLPLIEGLTAKLRLIWILGLLVSIWFVAWFLLKQYSLWLSASVGILVLLPSLILASFWWALEELKNLPSIAEQVVTDAHSGLQTSAQGIRAGKSPKLGFFSIGRSLWSVGAMVVELRELVGSYLTISFFANPIMLLLGLVSLVSVFLLFLTGLALAFFV